MGREVRVGMDIHYTTILWEFKGILTYNPQNGSSETQVKYFYLVESLCSILKIFKFLNV